GASQENVRSAQIYIHPVAGLREAPKQHRCRAGSRVLRNIEQIGIGCSRFRRQKIDSSGPESGLEPALGDQDRLTLAGHAGAAQAGVPASAAIGGTRGKADTRGSAAGLSCWTCRAAASQAGRTRGTLRAVTT